MKTTKNSTRQKQLHDLWLERLSVADRYRSQTWHLDAAISAIQAAVQCAEVENTAPSELKPLLSKALETRLSQQFKADMAQLQADDIAERINDIPETADSELAERKDRAAEMIMAKRLKAWENS